MPVPTSKPHRLSLSDVLTLVLSRGSAERDSVELSRNAKGETQIVIVARTREGETLEDVGERARDEYDRNRMRYPLASGYVGAEGGSNGS
jgi:hypothetical protein